MEKFLFTVKEFEELYSDISTVKRRNILVDKANNRTNYLVSMISKLFNYHTIWWDFDNEVPDNEQVGYYNPSVYIHVIDIVGQWKGFTKSDNEKGRKLSSFLEKLYNNFSFDDQLTIPANWLAQDIDNDLSNHVQNFFDTILPERIEAENVKRLEKEAHLRALRNSIKSKLTPEEYALISFPKHLL